eukprot:358810-Chlamydomonas_euryale.AAC.3
MGAVQLLFLQLHPGAVVQPVVPSACCVPCHKALCPIVPAPTWSRSSAGWACSVKRKRSSPNAPLRVPPRPLTPDLPTSPPGARVQRPAALGGPHNAPLLAGRHWQPHLAHSMVCQLCDAAPRGEELRTARGVPAEGARIGIHAKPRVQAWQCVGIKAKGSGLAMHMLPAQGVAAGLGLKSSGAAARGEAAKGGGAETAF